MKDKACDKLDQDLLMDHIGGRLDESRASHVEAHIAECSECRARERMLRALVEAVDEARIVDVSRKGEQAMAELRERASAAASDPRRAPGRRSRRVR